MRLLLDELYSKEIGDRLRGLGHDVVAVTERSELVGLEDYQLFSLMSSERRAIVTENAGDYMPLFREAATKGLDHLGFVFTSPRAMPRSKQTIGLFVSVLDELLRANSADDALLNGYRWLP